MLIQLQWGSWFAPHVEAFPQTEAALGEACFQLAGRGIPARIITILTGETIGEVFYWSATREWRWSFWSGALTNPLCSCDWILANQGAVPLPSFQPAGVETVIYAPVSDRVLASWWHTLAELDLYCPGQPLWKQLEEQRRVGRCRLCNEAPGRYHAGEVHREMCCLLETASTAWALQRAQGDLCVPSLEVVSNLQQYEQGWNGVLDMEKRAGGGKRQSWLMAPHKE